MHPSTQPLRLPFLAFLLLLPATGFALDRNGDGISDVWANLHPGATVPGDDPDGDGVDNRTESLAGTDPFSAQSRFAAAARSAGAGPVLEWHGQPGKRYRLEHSADLLTWLPETAVHVGEGATLSVPLPDAAPGGRQFWRVAVELGVDADGDGLDAWEEHQFGTSPTLADTDGDGSGDVAEFALGTNPLVTPPVGTTYHLDAVAGNDAGDGSAAHPWRTFKHALASVASGDTVLLYDGDYGTLIAGRTKDENLNFGDYALPLSHFSHWVTFKAAPGHHPRAERIDLGTLNTAERTTNNLAVGLPFRVRGSADLFLRFEDLTVEDGVLVRGSRQVEFVGCTVHRRGPLTGSIKNLDDKHGFHILNGRYLTIRDCEITGVSIGIAAAAYDVRIVGNHIHHNSHDGIRVWGGDTWLIEGNVIHDLDDGVPDVDKPLTVDPDPIYGGKQHWDRHADAIQIVVMLDVTSNGIVRGNVFYHLESMAIMFHRSDAPGRFFRNWTFENNLFGPVGGRVVQADTRIDGRFIFRHNTVVYAPQDRWISIYPTNQATGAPRVMEGQVYNIGFPACPDESYLYNNLFADGSEARVSTGSKASFSGSNFYRIRPSSSNALIRGDIVSSTLPYAEIPGNIDDSIAATGRWPGRLLAGSAAVDAGTRLGNDLVSPLSVQLDLDLAGTPRDLRPDLGAYEVAGRNPPAELHAVLPPPTTVLRLVDDFADGRLHLRDPYLNGPETLGLSWTMPDANNRFRTLQQSNDVRVLTSVFDFNPGLVVTEQVFGDIDFAFDHSTPLADCGVVVLFRDSANYTFYDFAGRLVRLENGVETLLAPVAVPAAAGRATLSLRRSGGAVTLTFTSGGSVLWTHTGPAPVLEGPVGFYRTRTTGQSFERVDYDNVRIDLADPAALVADPYR